MSHAGSNISNFCRAYSELSVHRAVEIEKSKNLDIINMTKEGRQKIMSNRLRMSSTSASDQHGMEVLDMFCELLS